MNKVHSRVLILVCSGILACQGYVAYRVHQHYETFNGLRQAAPRIFRGSVVAPASYNIRISDPPPPDPPPPEPPLPSHEAPKSLPEGLENGYYELEELNGGDSWQWRNGDWVKNAA